MDISSTGFRITIEQQYTGTDSATYSSINGSYNTIRYNVDTYDTEPITISNKITDISNFSSRNSSQSKSMKFPDTSNNRRIFGFISEMTFDANTSFNPFYKLKMNIMLNGIIFQSGILNLTSYTFDPKLNNNYFEGTFYGGNSDIFKIIGDQYLTDIDWSYLNHIWQPSAITQSWASNYSNGYFYGLADYGNNYNLNQVNGNSGIPQVTAINPSSQQWVYQWNTLSTSDFRPLIYKKTILDAIFRNANKSYTSNFLSSTFYLNTLNQYTPINMQISSTASLDLTFIVGNTNYQTFGWTQAIAPGSNTNLGAIYGTWSALQFNNNQPPNYGDTASLWNLTASYFKQPSYIGNGFNIPYQQKFCLDVAILVTQGSSIDTPGLPPYYGVNGVPPFWQTGTFIPSLYPFAPTSITFNRQQNPYGITISGGYTDSAYVGNFQKTGVLFNTVNGNYVNNFYGDWATLPIYGQNAPNVTAELIFKLANQQISTGSYILYGHIETDYLDNHTYGWQPLGVGEVIYPQLNLSIGDTFGNVSGTACTLNPSSAYQYRFYNVINPVAQPFQIIDMNQCIEPNLKQKEHLLSEFQLYNMLMEQDPLNPNNYIIEPRDQFYSGGKIIDLSKNLSIVDQEIPIVEPFLSNTQNRSLLFITKEDNDFYNEYFKREYNVVYGQERVILDNQTLVGEKKQEINFAQSCLTSIPNSQGFVVTNICKEKDGSLKPTGFKTRTIARSPSGTIPCVGSDFMTLRIDQGPQTYTANSYNDFVGFTPTFATYSSYPYMGHFYPNPINPTYDLNFGQNPDYYYTITNGSGFLSFNGLTVSTGTWSGVDCPNTLVNTYYANQIAEYNDPSTKIIECNLYVDLDFMINFSFRNQLYMDFGTGAAYYRVLEYNDFDPTSIKSTKFKLLKTDQITVPKTNIYKGHTTPIRTSNGGLSTVNTNAGSMTTHASNTLTTPAIVVGTNNTVVPTLANPIISETARKL
jgi:hypothetical protein